MHSKSKPGGSDEMAKSESLGEGEGRADGRKWWNTRAMVDGWLQKIEGEGVGAYLSVVTNTGI